MSDLAEAMHTAGPWSVQRDPSHFDTASTVVDATGDVVAQVGGRTNTWQEMEDNAQLIAAAPAMLKALEEIARCIHPSVGGAQGAIRKHALAAIAAAKSVG